MKVNTDGSKKLGTLQTSTLLELAMARNTELNNDIAALVIERDELPTDDLENRSAINDLIAEQSTKRIDLDAINSAKLALDAEVLKFVTVIKRTLDNRLKVRIVPNEPASDENYEVPFQTDTFVHYLKRKNPTRSASLKQSAADALALKLANERTAKMEVLKAELVKYPNGTEEFNKVLAQIMNLCFC
jgi:hypothetical protein